MLVCFGIIMVYLAFIFSIITVSIRRFRRLLLALPFFMLLTACDSSSSPSTAANNKTGSETTSVSAAENTDLKNSAEDSQDSDNSDSDNEMNDDIDEGQSLIAAAKTDDGAQTRRTPMISGARNESTLQATLMGDYGGILACSFCDNIDITLNLFADGSVIKTSIYDNPESPQVPLVESGIYRQDGNTITIVYENKNIESYRIQDNHLVMIDEDKKLDADYTLSRK